MSIPIINPNPVIVPATSAVTYGNSWIYSFSIIAPSIDSGSIRVELLPYNFDTQAILGNTAAEVVSFDLITALSALSGTQALFDILELNMDRFRSFALSGV